MAKTEELVSKTIEKVEQQRARESGKMMGVVHLRMFINTINKAVDVVQKAGVDVQASKKENKNYVKDYFKRKRKNGNKERKFRFSLALFSR